MNPNPISEAERQVLIAFVELADPIETPNNNFYTFYPKTIEEAATYFRSLREEWEGAFETLCQRGWLEPDDQGYCLTLEGFNQARQERLDHPPIWYWYREFFPMAARSQVYARFCERLYGQNLYQAGFSDKAQFDLLISVGRLSSSSRILDLGCGLGGVAEYLSDRSGAYCVGLDYTPEAVLLALQRTEKKRQRLGFREGHLDHLEGLAGQFDTLLSVDTLYMPNNLPETLQKMASFLQPGGQMLIYYSYFRFDPSEPDDLLTADGSPLAKALRQLKMPYQTLDVTRETYELMQRKHRLALEMKEEFLMEGSEMVANFLLAESFEGDEPYQPGNCMISRFLYRVQV